MPIQKIILQILLSGFFILSLSINAQLSTIASLPDLLSLCKTDSVSAIERQTALHFHKLINAYRKANRLDTIAWDDDLWLSCRNHNIWMASNSVVNHVQKTGTAFFSGKQALYISC